MILFLFLVDLDPKKVDLGTTQTNTTFPIYCKFLFWKRETHEVRDMLGACTVLQYFIMYLDLGFKLYIVLIFCGYVWTLVCIFIYIDVFYIDACVGKWILLLNDVWNVFLSTYIFTYYAVNKLFVYSLCLYDLNLSPRSWKTVLLFLL